MTASTKHCIQRAESPREDKQKDSRGSKQSDNKVKSPDYCDSNPRPNLNPNLNPKTEDDSPKLNLESGSFSKFRRRSSLDLAPARRLAATSGRDHNDHSPRRANLDTECDSSLVNVVDVVGSQLSSHQSKLLKLQHGRMDQVQDLKKRRGERLTERKRARQLLLNGLGVELRYSQLLLMFWLLMFSLISPFLAQTRQNRVVDAALVPNSNANADSNITYNNDNKIKTHQYQQQQQQQPQQASVPYKTVHVTQVCEWKSNLFVPKSNDIHFAQPFTSPIAISATLTSTSRNENSNHLNSNSNLNPNDGQQPESAIRIARQQQSPLEESSIVYESPSLLHDSQHPSRQQQRQHQQQHTSNFNFNLNLNGDTSQQQLVNNNININNHFNVNSKATTATTIERNEQKALVLALPIEFGQQFAGFEPACSIRLLVPENMRILAQITSRRLKFEFEDSRTTTNSHGGTDNNNNLQQQPPFFGLPPSPAFLWPQPPPTLSSNFNFNANQQPNNNDATIWLNVSSDPFNEFGQKTIETQNNELAFRFILERNAHKKFPDLRFQVVVTAFQTLSENSDLSQGTGQWLPAANQGEQFICDQQRLISANLACDGYKNCQDGQDEEAQACALVRHSSNAAANNQQQPTFAMGNQGTTSGNQSTASGDNSSSGSLWPRWFSSSPNSKAKQHQQQEQANSDATNNREWASVTGFLLGFLLVLVLLLACVLPLCYCLFLLLCTNRDRLRSFFSHGSSNSGNNLSQHQQDRPQPQQQPEQKRGQAIKNIAEFLRRPLPKSKRREPRLQNRVSIARLERERLNEMRRQNANNERRLSALIETSSSSRVAQQPTTHTRDDTKSSNLQSILKRPASVQPVSGSQFAGPSGVATMQQQQRPLEPPPNIPERPIRRGALASSLRSRGSSGSRQASIVFPRQSQQQQQQQQQAGGFFARQDQSAPRPLNQAGQFKPTPAQRLTRPTRPVPPPAMSTQFNQQQQQNLQEQRVTTYHFSSASTSFSQAFLERLPSSSSGGGRLRLTSGLGTQRRGSTNDDLEDRQQQQQQQHSTIETNQPSIAKKAGSNLTSLI